MSANIFQSSVSASVSDFARNSYFTALNEDTLNLDGYQNLLCALFAQVRSSSTTFALAAAHMPDHYWPAKEYLFQHAHEEATHWRWILDDLRATCYQGAMPEQVSPPVSTAAYIAYNHFIATTEPIGRLAIASVLEGIGAEFGGRYGKRVVERLALKPTQCSFLLGHAESDVAHIREIASVLEACEIDDVTYARMANIARTAGRLYAAIYDEAAAQHGA